MKNALWILGLATLFTFVASGAIADAREEQTEVSNTPSPGPAAEQSQQWALLPAFQPGASAGGAGAPLSTDPSFDRTQCGGVTCVLHYACDGFWCWCVLNPYSACLEGACRLNCDPPSV